MKNIHIYLFRVPTFIQIKSKHFKLHSTIKTCDSLVMFRCVLELKEEDKLSIANCPLLTRSIKPVHVLKYMFNVAKTIYYGNRLPVKDSSCPLLKIKH